jgi:hypothetical protein
MVTLLMITPMLITVSRPNERTERTTNRVDTHLMPERSSLALALLIAGVALVALAALVWSGALSWFGRLPGDIRVERPGVRLYAPITSMIIVSIVLTILLSLFRRFWS